MNCPKCNTINNNESKFCGSCGHPLTGNTVINEQPEILTTNEPATPIKEAVIEQNVPQPQVITNEQNYVVTNNNIVSNNLELNPNSNMLNENNNQPKKNKKKIIILCVFISIVAIITIIIFLFSNTTINQEKLDQQKINSIFAPDKLIKIKSNNKYGFINSKGKVVIKEKYNYATEFKGDYAIVQTEVTENDLTKTVYQVIDKKGNVKKEAERGIEYIEETSSWIINDELYNSSMKKISPDNVRVKHEEDNYYIWVNSQENTGGLMNEKGKQIYTYTFKDGEDSIYIDIADIDETQQTRYGVVNIDYDYYAIINCDTGAVIYDYTTDRITEDNDNIFTVKDQETYGFKEILYIQDDKKMYTSINSEIDLYYYPGYVTIRDGSKPYSDRYTYLNTTTGKIQGEQPESETEENVNEWEKLTNNKKFSCSTGYGLMNKDTITLSCDWDSIEYIDLELYKYLKENKKDYIYGKKDGKWYLIDLDKKQEIVKFNTSYLTEKKDTTFIYYTDSDTETTKVFNLLSNKSINVESTDNLNIYSNYITIQNNSTKTTKYYNTDLELIYTENI